MRAIVIFCMLLTLLVAGSCGKGRQHHALKGKVYWHSEDGSPTNLDPVQSATTYSNLMTTALYDMLYDYKYLKRPYTLKPSLATAMPEISDDGLVYTIKIKQGVRFIDDPAFKDSKGREVVAQDFVYSIKRHFDPQNRSQGAWLWRGRLVGLDAWKDKGADYAVEVEGLKTIDRYTIQIKLVEPYPQILYTLAMGFAAIVPREAVEKYGREFSIHPVGSGPFMLQSFNTKKAILVRNPNYREDILDLEFEGYDEKMHGFTGIKALDGKRMPIVDAVIISFMKQSTARWNSFTKGNETQYTRIPLEQTNAVLASKKPLALRPEYAKKYFLKGEFESGFVYGIFNMADPAFGYSKDPKRNAMNKALRHAIRKAFNWPQRIKRFYYDIGEAFPGVIPPGVAGYSELPRDSIIHDVEGAKKLLKEAGWTSDNLPEFEYPGAASLTNKRFFEQFRGWMAKIGYPKHKIKHKPFANFGDYSKSMREAKNRYNSLAWGLDYPDGENCMQLFYGPNKSPGSNSANFDHPQFNKLFEQAKILPHCKERTELYRKMHEILLEECVVISGFSRTRLQMWHQELIAYPSREIIGNYFKYVDIKK